MNRLSFLRRIIGLGAAAAVAPEIVKACPVKKAVKFPSDYNFYPSQDVLIADGKWSQIMVPFSLKRGSRIPRLGDIIIDRDNQIDYVVTGLRMPLNILTVAPCNHSHSKSFYKNGTYFILPF